MNRLSLFYDIAGRLSKDSQIDKFFTVGGIIIPTCDEVSIRNAIGRDMPKWTNSNPASLSLIANIFRNHAIHCTVVKIQKTEPAWTNFWNAGEKQSRHLSSKTKSKTGFAKPANVLKYLSLSKCFAISLGLYIRLQGVPNILDQHGFSALCLKVVCDTDIQGQENQQVLKKDVEDWCKDTSLTTQLEIKPYIEVIEFQTEQEDILLLLPDYFAGYVHYSSAPQHIALPANLSPHDAKQFGVTLSTSGRFNLKEHSFDERFPNLISGENSIKSFEKT